MDVFARTPKPPYVAVIFTSLRAVAGDHGYGEMAGKLIDLAGSQRGYLGIDTACTSRPSPGPTPGSDPAHSAGRVSRD